MNDRKRRDAAAMGLGVKAMENVRGRWEVGLGKRRRWRHKDVVVLRVVVVVVGSGGGGGGGAWAVAVSARLVGSRGGGARVRA